MLTGALLGIIEDAGKAVLTLTEGVDDATLFSLRLTREESVRQLLVIADTATNLPAGARETLAAVDWDGWAVTARVLRGPYSGAARDALSFGVRSMVPATLMGLRLYRKSHPELFAFKP
jgi:uncharacterized protein with HEPN domain